MDRNTKNSKILEPEIPRMKVNFNKLLIAFALIPTTGIYAGGMKQDNTRYFLSNGKSDVAQLVEKHLNNTRDYDAYGSSKTLNHSAITSYPSDNTSFGYNKEYQENTMDMLYLRSRFYDENTRRFLTRDTKLDEPNKYGFANAMPTMMIDPSGHTFELVTEFTELTELAIKDEEIEKYTDDLTTFLRGKNRDNEAKELEKLASDHNTKSPYAKHILMQDAVNFRARTLKSYGLEPKDTAAQVRQKLGINAAYRNQLANGIAIQLNDIDVARTIIDMTEYRQTDPHTVDALAELADFANWHPFLPLNRMGVEAIEMISESREAYLAYQALIENWATKDNELFVNSVENEDVTGYLADMINIHRLSPELENYANVLERRYNINSKITDLLNICGRLN
ncbi:MAG: RHS repeat-associated core domain-containing protein [Francisellaceae bacterium]